MNKFIIFFIFFGFVDGSSLPLVVLPTAIRWNSENSLIVTPRDWSSGVLDIKVAVFTKYGKNSKKQLFAEFRQVSDTGISQKFFFNSSHKPDSFDYEIQINVTNHEPYSTTLFGGPDLKFITVETDKGHYSPGQKVDLRILPVTEEGDLFKLPLRASLVNVQGFKVVTDTVQAKNRFIRHSFEIPEFAQPGPWTVTVDPLNSTLPWMAAQTRILVQDYTLPKFFVSMHVKDCEEYPDCAKVHLHAKYPNRVPVAGSAVVECGNRSRLTGFESKTNLQIDGIGTSPADPDFDFQLPSRPLSTKQQTLPPSPNGRYLLHPDLHYSHGSCKGVHPRYIGIGSLYNKDFHFWIRYLKHRKHEKEEPHLIDPEDDVLETPPPWTMDEKIRNLNNERKKSDGLETTIELIALKEAKRALGDLDDLKNGFVSTKINVSQCTVENGIVRVTASVIENSDEVRVVREYRPRAPDFQMIPLRPIFDASTKSIQIYFKSLRKFENSPEISGVYQCISNNNFKNGLNTSFYTTVNQIVDIEVDPDCKLYRVISRRNISTGKSDDVFLFVPQISKFEELSLSMIAAPKKVVYNVGDRFETVVKPITNYIVICNRNEIVQTGSVPTNGAILFTISQDMQGFCVLHVYGNNKIKTRNLQSDMWIFFVEKAYCPSAFSLTSNKRHLSPPKNLTVVVKAKPTSLGVIRAIDERFNHIVDYMQVPKTDIYWNFQVFMDPSRELNAPRLVNFLDSSKIHKAIRDQCLEAGKIAPADNYGREFVKLKEISDLSEDCGEQYLRGQKWTTESLMGEVNNYQKNQQRLAKGQIFSFGIHSTLRPPLEMRVMQSDAPGNGPSVMTPEFEDELFLRTFFPEVWYFDDLRFGSRSEHSLHLKSPHSVSIWTFSGVFWTPGSRTTCSTPDLHVETRRHVFMEVNLPTHVYENETIAATVTISGDNFKNEKKLSLCFTGVSPVVCADMGQGGERAETEYTRITLSKHKKRDEKIIHFRFLKAGIQNVSFELREEVNVVGSAVHHCADPSATVYDRIEQIVKVEKSLAQKEHFRQINIYPQRKIFKSNQAVDLPSDKPNVIRFQQNILSDTEVETSVFVDQDVEIITTSVEFSEYQPSFPLGVVSNEISSSRTRRSLYNSFSEILMDYAFATYDQKQGKLNGNLPEGSLKQEIIESRLHNLRMQLFKFSNCTSDEKQCAFGEFGPPGGDVPPSLLYTATVTSLMCEENVEDVYVCGPLNYLANWTKTGVENLNVDLHGQISFANKDEEIYFIQAVLKQTFDDCAMKTCLKNLNIYNLTEPIFRFGSNRKHYDIRVIASVATVASHLVAGTLRHKIREMADTDRMPYWTVDVPLDYNSLEELDLFKSAEVTANSLAMLAFVNQSTDVYEYYRSQLNLPRLAEWIIEEQISDQRFQTALDTFYAWRALYRYNERLTGPRTGNQMKIILSGAEIPTRIYSNEDMPFSVQLPSTLKNFTIKTSGEGRIVAGIRVLASPRKRSKRDDDSSPSIVITANQTKVYSTDNDVMQKVCIQTKSALLKQLEINHHLYTGFSSSFSKFSIVNPSGVHLIGLRRTSVTGLHFTLGNLTSKIPICYQLVIREPSSSYTPAFLNPVTIEARYNQIHNELLLYASDIKVTFPGAVGHRSRHGPFRNVRRSKRSNPEHISELVDTVCLEHGTCTCAELSCSAKCMRCNMNFNDLYNQITQDIKSPGRFGIIAQFNGSSDEIRGNDTYTRVSLNVFDVNKQLLIFGCGVPKMNHFILWIRHCNRKPCFSFVEGGIYVIVGNSNGFFQDFTSVSESSLTNSTQILLQHYLLRDGDTIDGGKTDGNNSCIEIITKLFLFKHFCN